VMRAKYQGEKLWAWLVFYQPAKKCARPKSIGCSSSRTTISC
jgi:hypothetical protein